MMVTLHNACRAGACVAALLLTASVAPFACADVYTWTDAAGRVNVSNLPPPREAQHVQVVKPDATAKARIEAAQAASREAARKAEVAAREAAHDAQVQALQARVAELERSAALARSAPPPTLAAVAPAPRVVVSVPAPLDNDVAPLPAWNCAWVGCGWPVVVAAIPSVGVHRFRPGRHGHRARPPHTPMTGGGGDVPVNPAGNVPINPAGTVPVNPAGNVPVDATGRVPVDAAGNAPIGAAGRIPLPGGSPGGFGADRAPGFNGRRAPRQ
jgi:hypothetical protein